MKKILLGLVFATIASGLASAKSHDNKRDCSCPPQQDSCRRASQKPQCPSPFEGIELTSEQKTKLDALKDECDPQKQKCDKAKADKQKAKKQEIAERQQAKRKEYLAKIKEILTPEQYVQFLENSFMQHRPDKKGFRPDRKQKERKGHRHGNVGTNNQPNQQP